MELPSSVVYVRSSDFPSVALYVQEMEFDVVDTELCGYRGFGFWQQAELSRLLSFLNERGIEFRLMDAADLDSSTDSSVRVPEAPPPSPTSNSSTESRGTPDGASDVD